MKHIWKRDTDGGQSDVFQDGDVCVKVYSGLQRADIVSYHRVQTLLKNRVCTLLTKTQQYQGQEIQEVEVQFLPLALDSIEPQAYTSIGISQVTTRVPFVEGESFAQAFSRDPMFSEFVQKRVLKFLKQEFPSLTIGEHQLSKHNIKVVSFENGKLRLLVTDIAQNIRTFIDANKDKIALLTQVKDHKEK